MSRKLSCLQAVRGEWILLAALAASYPASLVLPAAWSREGGLLENLQVVVLGVGCALALLGYLRSRPARVAMLALWAAPVWLLLAGRELSWGKAWLLQPGAEAMAATAHWAGPLARTLAVVLLAWLVFSAWHYRIDGPVRAAFARRVPWLCLFVTVAGAMGSTCAEGHMYCHLDMAVPSAQLFEELCELLAYVALGMIQHVVFTHQSPVHLAPAIVHPVEEVG
ncbi:hypothetical protein [Massilia sp. HP4]|uniref:hypothetical protein n=1 Tax=Massilia sp. HP4 TaxID=2562316 RepID=UPI0010C028E4|nr:hypothetical protein [Massilia sp. HP4]